MGSFKSWTNSGKQADHIQMLSFFNYMALNTLAPIYHSAFGYHLDEHIQHQKKKDMSPLSFDLLPGLLKRTKKGPTEIKINVDLKKAKKYAKTIKLPHKTVIVRLSPPGVSYWIKRPSKVTKTFFGELEFELDEPVYWYEYPYQEHHHQGLVSKPEFVEKLSERSYIHVIEPFEEVEVCSIEKGKPITIDDVLFACRGLCADDTRSLNELHVFSDDGSKLVLIVDIDNWST